jgi:hypothetical protein
MIKVAGFVCLPFLLMYAQAGGDAPVLEVASTPTVESHENALGETVAAQAIAQDVRNISSKCVLGFVLKVELFNASGKSMGRHARLVFRGGGYSLDSGNHNL